MRRNDGITLMEMLVVMTIIGLLASVATPAVTAGMETVKLRTSAERLAATLRLARVSAVRTRHYFQVTVDPQARRVELRDLESDFVRDWQLPETVSMKLQRSLLLQFAPDGSVPSLHMELENSRRRIVAVDLDAFTALPSVRTADERR